MGKFSDRIFNKPLDDMVKFNIEKENARLQGKYPMSVIMLKEEIMKVTPALQMFYGDAPIGASKWFMMALADGLGNDPDKIFKYYINEVRPYIFNNSSSEV